MRRENFHIIYVLLFLEAALFIFQIQTNDEEKYAQLVAFIPSAVLEGEFWRLLTFQFASKGAIGFFFSLLILYIMGNAMEEQWGSADFVAFWALSILGTVAVGFLLGAPLLGSFFSFALLFAYAATYPEMTFLILFVLPVKVKWIAWGAIGLLGVILLVSPPYSLATAGGAAASFTFFWRRHGSRVAGPIAPRLRRKRGPLVQVDPAVVANEEKRGESNLALFGEVQKTLDSGDPEAIESMLGHLDREKTPNVNICPPADFKPLNEDRFCARCEGFAECSARFVRASTANEEDDSPAASRG